MFIAHTNLQFIIEIAILIHVVILILFNIVYLPLSLVLFLALVFTFLIAGVFAVDAVFLLLPMLSHHEFTHPFGALAVFGWVTIAASASLLAEENIKSNSIKAVSLILFFTIAVAGGLMHKSFLILWFLGWAISYFIMSKSFKRESRINTKTVFGFIGAGIGGFAILELLSRILNASVLSPLLRIARLEQYSFSSLKTVLVNTTFWGHVQGSCYWGANCLGGSDGYITLPVTLIQNLGLPYHIFYGVLIVKKDYIDYMLPGIFAYAYDAGYFGLLFILAWTLIVSVSGFIVLRDYRTKRKEGNKQFLGREALLIGSLSAFLSQSIIGLFIFNRSINESALLAYIIISALVIAHVVLPIKTFKSRSLNN